MQAEEVGVAYRSLVHALKQASGVGRSTLEGHTPWDGAVSDQAYVIDGYTPVTP